MKKIKQGIRVVLRGIVKGALFAFFKVVYRAKIVGTENIPKDGALIFCGNHRSYLDPPLREATGKRNMRFLAKEELYNNKFLAFLGWVFEAIPVKRDEKDVAAIKTSSRNGREKGQKVKDGVAFFAVRSGAKVIPCGIKGGTKGDWKMTITYGKPLDYSEYKSQAKDKEVLDKVTNEIMNNILELAK